MRLKMQRIAPTTMSIAARISDWTCPCPPPRTYSIKNWRPMIPPAIKRTMPGQAKTESACKS